MRKRAALLLILAALSLTLTPIAEAAKTVAPIPSPSPKWPPVGFTGKDGVYAKIPTSKELVGLLSAKTALQSTIKTCQQFSCGAVFVAALNGCSWWEINSTVYGVDPTTMAATKLGSLATYETGSGKLEQKTIFLISGVPVAAGVSVGKIKVICHPASDTPKKPGNNFNPVASPSPSS